LTTQRARTSNASPPPAASRAVHADDATVLAQQAGDRAVVQHHRAALRRGARQSERQAGVVELPVPVLDAAGQAARLHVGQQFARARGRQELGVPDAARARQRVVHLQARAVERRLPQPVGRHHEGQRLRQVRRIGQQRGALGQRLAHQRHVALRQVAHAAVHELGGARAGALGEVVRFEQQHREAARRGVQRHAAGRWRHRR
jgi:hypothetical protein